MRKVRNFQAEKRLLVVPCLGLGFALAERKKRKNPPEGGRFIQWLGYLDSNQGITVSETVVLPLDYIPRALNSLEIPFLFVNSFFRFPAIHLS